MKRFTASLALVGLAAPLVAQQPAQPPIRQLGPVTATSKDSIGFVGHIRALPGGRLLLNDILRRRVLLLDSTMSVVRVVADSTSGTANAYGARAGGLIPFAGDSTLFVDPASLSMLVIDPAGAIARVMSVPRPQEANSLASVSFGQPAFDASGRLVYRQFPQMMFRGGPGAAPPQIPDTAAIVRLDLATRAVDTIGYVRIPRVQTSINRTDDGRVTMSQIVNPLPVVDEWAVTSAGRIALIRGRDYHVDWVDGGSLKPAPKIPFDWQRLTDEDKVALLDSVKVMRERMAASGATPQMMFGGAGGAPAPAAQMQVRTMAGDGAARGNAGTTVTVGNAQMNISYVSPSELPDYKPAFMAGAVRADADGNLWVRTVPTKQLAGGPVYDVIDGTGALVDRVQIPAEREVRGFGPGGIVYLTGRVDGRLVVEAARVR